MKNCWTNKSDISLLIKYNPNRIAASVGSLIKAGHLGGML